MMPPLRVGRLARLANVNVQTLRFYERKGLLPPPSRRLSGYREYPSETIGIVKLIKYVQGLGFSLKEIKSLIALRNKPSVTLSATCGFLENKISEIDAKVADLTAVRSTLVEMLINHHQRSNASFAHAFDRHVEQLSGEAISLECLTARKEPQNAAERRNGRRKNEQPS
jgi:DNA-binding transcriptional MerR regulator